MSKHSDTAAPFNITVFNYVSEVETSLLVIVVDLHTRQRYLRDQPSQLMHVLDSVISLANMHLMLKTKNKVAIVGCNASYR